MQRLSLLWSGRIATVLLITFSPIHAFLIPQSSSPSLTTPTQKQQRRQTSSLSTHLSLSKDTNNSNNQPQGVYTRPSAAIEKGSGFFIPGLEGPRVRLLFGTVILLFTAINRGFTIDSSNSSNNSFPETVAIVYGILLLLQAAIEFGKEEKGFGVVSLDPSSDDGDTSSNAVVIQRWKDAAALRNRSPAWQDKIQWSAASYLAMTPATNVFLIQHDDGIVYRIGSANEDTDPTTADSELEGCRLALETLANAKSDRVSLPLTHPAVTRLAQADTTRCVILQSINSTRGGEEEDTTDNPASSSSCWMVTSDQLLQAFTPQDLKWLGQLAAYVKDE